MTLKTYVIFDHYSDYFQWTKKSFRHTSGEFVESTHATIKKMKGNMDLKLLGKLAHQITVRKH